MKNAYILSIAVLASCVTFSARAMDAVTLKDGVQAPRIAVTMMMFSLRQLFNKDIAAFVELSRKCKDSNYSFKGNTGQVIAKHGINVNTPLTCQIVRNAVEGEGLQTKLTSPIKE